MLIKIEQEEQAGKKVNSVHKQNVQDMLDRTKELYKRSQALTNKYWGIYKTETGKQNISIGGKKKTASEKKISQKLKQ